MTDAETTTVLDPVPETGGGLRVPRSRGVVSGVLLILAGAWGALAPFVGPSFDFAYTPKPDQTWHWTAARGWYEVLPGGLAVLGGLLLVLSANRILTSFGAWLAVLAGGWFVVGQQVSFLLTLGSPGAPAARGDRRYVAEYLAFFTGLGAVIILFAALALGRLSVRSVRDVRAAARRDHEAALAEQEAADREAAERDDYERSTADRAVTDRNAETWAGGQDAAEVGRPASAVTSELPVAGAAAGATALGGAASSGDEHAAYRRSDEDDHPAGPEDDTAAMPVAPERAAAEPVLQPEPAAAEPAPPVAAQPESIEPEAAQPKSIEPEAAQPEQAQPEPAEPPLLLEPPEGHPDAHRHQAAQTSAPPPAEQPPAPPTTEPSASTPSSTPSATWNPEAQSPTTTGELPTVTSGPPPEAAAVPSRRGIQQPRRYFGPGNPAPADDAPAAAAPAPAAPEDRDAVRTDEGIDLDHEMDLDERPR